MLRSKCNKIDKEILKTIMNSIRRDMRWDRMLKGTLLTHSVV